MRARGTAGVLETVARYHELAPSVAGSAWHPEAVRDLDTPEWRQLYVNAEHDGTVGVVTLSRESYSWDVDQELNRALDWLLEAGIRRVIVTSDFHISTQMVGADTGEFFPALEDVEAGLAITRGWSRTARRLWDDFEVSVACVPGKRCLGGMLELVMHAHYLVAVEDARFGWPEVTLPVVPGMEACHWPLRRAAAEDRGRILEMLLTGRPVRARDAVGWLVDVAAPLDEALAASWALATGAETEVPRRPLETRGISGILGESPALAEADGPSTAAGREAIRLCVDASCCADLDEALEIQARHAAEFLAGDAIRQGAVGAEYARTMRV
jgi:enoyl-CoA hydratase/carnithine racemase